VQGRAHARTVEGVREVSVTFISRSEPADLPYPWEDLAVARVVGHMSGLEAD